MENVKEQIQLEELKVEIDYASGLWESTVISLPLLLYVLVMLPIFVLAMMAEMDNTTMMLLYIFGAVPVYMAVLLWINALATKYVLRSLRESDPETANELARNYCLTSYSTGRGQNFRDFVFERKGAGCLTSTGMQILARIIANRYLLLLQLIMPLIFYKDMLS